MWESKKNAFHLRLEKERPIVQEGGVIVEDGVVGVAGVFFQVLV